MGDIAGHDVDAADDLRDGLRRVALVARVFPLGREGQEEVDPRREPALLEGPSYDLVGGTGVGGRFEDDELAAAEVQPDGLCGLPHVRQVRLLLRRQRRRHANEDRVGLVQPGEIGGRLETLRFARPLHARPVDVADVALASIEGRDLLPVDVEAEDAESLVDEGQREREADVALPDDADVNLVSVDATEEGVAQGGEGLEGHGGLLRQRLGIMSAGPRRLKGLRVGVAVARCTPSHPAPCRACGQGAGAGDGEAPNPRGRKAQASPAKGSAGHKCRSRRDWA